LKVIETVQEEGISQAELNKVIKQVRAQVAYSGESVTNQAMQLGMWEVLDSYKRHESLLDEFQNVTIDDVQRVARTYLSENRRTVGYFIPTSREAFADFDDEA